MPDVSNYQQPEPRDRRQPDNEEAFERLAQEWARIADPGPEDYSRVYPQLPALGKTPADLLERAAQITVELDASAMTARGGEILLGGLRAEVFSAAIDALCRSGTVFRQGLGDDLKLVAVSTPQDARAVALHSMEQAERQDEQLRAREEQRDESGNVLATTVAEPWVGDQMMTFLPVMLAMEIDRAARVKKAQKVKRNGRAATEWVPADFPLRLASELMDAKNLMGRLPELRGVAHAPIVDRVGGLHAQPGYHAESKMWISAAVPHVDVPVAPTREEARRAVEKLEWLLRMYEFDGPHNKAAGVALVMTAALRPSMRKAPMAVSTSGQARTGKDHLLRTAALVGVGRTPTLYSLGTRAEEQDKRLSQIFHTGSPFVVLSNINGTLSSDDLCVFLSEGTVIARSYGSVGAGKQAEYSATWAVSGNNVEIKSDLVARCFTVRQVSSNPHPGDRVFDFNSHTWLLDDPANRAAILAAVFTIVRWWRQLSEAERAGVVTGATNEFEEWADLVRWPLLALTGRDVFAPTREAEIQQRASDSFGEVNDAAGEMLTAAWRLDYPWSQADAKRRVDRWRERHGGDLMAPPHIQAAEAMLAENAGVLTDAEVCERVEALAPSEFSVLASEVTRAAARVRQQAADWEDDAERGGGEPAAAQSAWMEEARAALPRLGKAAESDKSAGIQFKKCLDVPGVVWRMTLKRGPDGQPVTGGANRGKAVYHWRRL